MNTCEQSANNPDYLIAQNGDARKALEAQSGKRVVSKVTKNKVSKT